MKLTLVGLQVGTPPCDQIIQRQTPLQHVETYPNTLHYEESRTVNFVGKLYYG